VILGAWVLIAIVDVESSGFKAEERFKHDMLSLTASIDSLGRKISNEIERKTPFDYDKEYEVINNFINSPSMIALLIWVQKSKKKSDEHLYGKITVNFDLLCHHYRCYKKSSSTEHLIQLLNPWKTLRDILKEINEQDINEISYNLANPGKSYNEYLKVSETKDPYIKNTIQVLNRGF